MATQNPYPTEPSLAALWEEGYEAGREDLKQFLLNGLTDLGKAFAALDKIDRARARNRKKKEGA